MLTPTLAQQLADENADATGLGILITDCDGMVIGSSDPRRIGTFHEASIEVVRSHEPASHSAKQAAALKGVRPGTTLPIIVDDEVVGTVGITGSPGAVRRLGPLVRRHTEMLLRESAALRSQLIREKNIEDLVRDIAGFDPDLIETAALHARAEELRYSLDVPRIAIVFGLSGERATDQDPSSDAASVVRAEVIRAIREQFRDPQDIVAAGAPGRFVVLHPEPRQHAGNDASRLEKRCAAVMDAVAKRCGLRLRAAIGGRGATPIELKTALGEGQDTLALAGRLGANAPQTTTWSAENLRVYQVLSATNQRSRHNLIDAELAILREQPQWPALEATITAWCESGFRLVDAAARLHVHRNTLVYRLARIEKLTGRDTREFTNAIKLYLACLAARLDPG